MGQVGGEGGRRRVKVGEIVGCSGPKDAHNSLVKAHKVISIAERQSMLLT